MERLRRMEERVEKVWLVIASTILTVFIFCGAVGFGGYLGIVTEETNLLFRQIAGYGFVVSMFLFLAVADLYFISSMFWGYLYKREEQKEQIENP